MSFSILNTRLGSRLESLKQNGPFYLSSPFVVNGTTVLNNNTASQALVSGILCDITNSSVTITFPDANTLYDLLGFDFGNYVNFDISAYSDTFPNPNTLSIVDSAGITSLLPVLSPQETYYATLICVSLNPIKFYIM